MRERPWLPYALVLGVGLTLGALQYALDNRDPLVFTIPILGLTAVTLLVMRLSGRGEHASMERLAAEQGLRYDGVGPLPSVTSILAGVREPAHIFTARLPDRGPRVRLAEVRGRRVAITDAPPPERLDAKPPNAEVETEDGLLVVAVGKDVAYRDLLDLVERLHTGL